MSDRDVDAEFADIIAHWDDVLPEPGAIEGAVRAGEGHEPGVPETPADPESPEHAADTTGPAGPAGRSDSGDRGAPARPAGVNPPPTRPFVVWRGADQGVPEDQAVSQDHAGSGGPGAHDAGGIMDEDEHFEPGPTAPLPPQEDLQFWGIIVGLVLGPILLLWQVLQSTVSFWWTVGALGLTVGGFVLLVMRQPHTRDEDDPDDGARV